jgi:cytochrome c biogenesis protein CcdA/thiol-disulfide isomerase/thioredoxin
MSLFFLALFAGVLTALAPCVLPLLPLIVGSSLVGGSKYRTYIIIGSMVASLFFFTIVLKATTTLLGVPPYVWQFISGVIIIGLGITSIWPHLYEIFATKSGFYGFSQRFLGANATKSGVLSAILTGIALGPVFSSCSPTYALILATILPTSFALGLFYLGIYIIGLAAMLLLVVALGRKFTSRLGWALNPDGWFKRGLGILFVLIGFAVLTGYDKQLENYVEGVQFLNVSNLEKPFLPHNTGVAGSSDTSNISASGAVFAVKNPIKAPEITGITNWINSNGESIAALKGKVVLIDFWTYSCINCIHTLPHVTSWYEKYKDQGLVVLGIHAPEFSFEHVPANVAKAVKDDNIHYPVGLDNNYATWNAYGNQYWPAEYFIDREGNIRHYKFGEGDYANDELVIQALLKENGTKVGQPVSIDSRNPASTGQQSPETYLGYERATANQNDGGLKNDTDNQYRYSSPLAPNGWAYTGTWNVGALDTKSVSDSKLFFSFTAKQVYLVMGSSTPAKVTVLVNGKPVVAEQVAGADVGQDGSVIVSDSRLYRLVNSASLFENATLELDIPSGVVVNAFTFDS